MHDELGSPAAVAVITTAHLILIAILAALVVVAIVWGARLRRARRLSRADAEARREEAPDVPQQQPAVAAPATAAPLPDRDDGPAVPMPVATAPAPPPLEPAIATAGPATASEPVTILKGLGPKVAARLSELGVTRVDQLAALDPAAAAALDDRLGPFKGRMARDRWLEQAQLLAAGDRAGFEAQFGKLG